MGAADPDRDLFVSYRSNDRQWAEWIGWQLEVSGVSVYLDRWDNPTWDHHDELRDEIAKSEPSSPTTPGSSPKHATPPRS